MGLGLSPQILQHQRNFAVDRTEDRRVQGTRIIITISLFTIGPNAGVKNAENI